VVRPVVAAQLPWCLGGVCLPHVDPGDPQTCFRGVQGRVCTKPPVCSTIRLRKLRRFTLKFCKKYLIPLSPDTDFSIETWLSQTGYPRWRKIQLLEAYEKLRGTYLDVDKTRKKNGSGSNYRVDGFTKDEHYADWKPARAIHARVDAAKVLTGPIFKAIENEVFKLKYFIKKVPKADRPAYIKEWMYEPASLYMATDYARFESHFTKDMMDAIEKVMYKYMTAKIPMREMFWFFLDNILCGSNRIVYKFFRLVIEATRMSGEMNTSLGNGFANLILLLYVMVQAGYKLDEIRAIIEGDDGLTRVDKDKLITAAMFFDLGFTIELDIYEFLNEASFCGNIFDVEDLVIITDVLKSVSKLGWTRALYQNASRKKMMGLLRSKALSMLYEYTGCPVLQCLAMRLLTLTEGVRAKNHSENLYEREKYHEMMTDIRRNGLPFRLVPIHTRLLVEKLFSISIEIQLAVEAKIEETVLGECFLDELLMMSPVVWLEYYQRYTFNQIDFGFMYPMNYQTGVKFNAEFLKNMTAI